MKKLFFLLMGAVLVFSWELKKQQNGIEVYTQNVKNSKYDEFKAVADVNVPFSKLKSVLFDFKNYPKWQKKIENIEVKDGYMLKEIDFPFPLSNRFAFYKIDITKGMNFIQIKLTSIPYSRLPEKIKKEFKKPSCVEMKDNVLLKAEKTDKGTRVTYAANVDPKGAPAFIFNYKIVGAAYDTLENLKVYLKQ